MSGTDGDNPADVYKILPANEWERAVGIGAYEGSADDKRDGFIHLSTAVQLRGTAEKFFKGQTGLVLVRFNADDLGAELKWEPSRGGALFPHLYGKLPADKALSVIPLELGGDGVPAMPGGIEP